MEEGKRKETAVLDVHRTQLLISPGNGTKRRRGTSDEPSDE